MNEEKLKKFLNKNCGYIKTNEFEKLGISKPSIQTYVDKKTIRKVSHGLYIDNNLYTVSETAIKVNDLDSLKQVGEIKIKEVPTNTTEQSDRKDENDTIVLDEKDEHKIENNTIVIE